MPATTSLLSRSDEFIQTAAKAWKLVKGTKEKVEPLSKASEDLELAERAMSGSLPAYSAGIERVRVFAARQRDRLADFARKDENYWLDRSGVNLFDQSTMSPAKACLDQWITSFSQLETLIVEFLPAVETARNVLSNPGVVGVRSALEESSLPALEGFALGQVVGDLNNSVRSLGIILHALRACRRVL